LSFGLLVSILGPTAAGKSAVALKIAEHFHTEIISADSRQFYRELNIGTAKPTKKDLEKIPHHFINSHSIHDNYTAGMYGKEARALIKELFKKHNIVLLVGGSGLFVKAVLEGLDEIPGSDKNIREKYEKLLEEKGIEYLTELLKEKDLEYYNTVDQHNPRRIIRALEAIELSGIPYSEQRKKMPAPYGSGKNISQDFDILKIGIYPGKEILNAAIEARIRQMLDNGWLEECKQLEPFKNLNSLNTVGYKELFAFLDNKLTWEQTINEINTKTRQYAKRQLTWFRKDKEIKWFEPEEVENVIREIKTKL
jgi:tRNA dimethylallyltransferase